MRSGLIIRRYDSQPLALGHGIRTRFLELRGTTIVLMDPVDGLLTPYFLEAGFGSYVSAMNFHRKKAQATSVDQAWHGVFLGALREFRVLRMGGEYYFQGIEAPLAERGVSRLLNRLAVPANALDLVIAIAESCIESVPPPEKRVSTLQDEILEGLLWRVYDGFKAVQALLPLALLADVHLINRAVTEAVLKFDFFAKDANRCKKYVRSCLAQEVETIEWWIAYNERNGHVDNQFLRDEIGKRQTKLDRCQTRRVYDSTGKGSWEGQLPKNNPDWRNLVDDEILSYVFEGSRI